MILYIDTTQDHKLELALYTYEGKTKDELIIHGEHDKSEQLLKALQQLLSRSKTDKISGVVVLKGPQGRFSAIRRGVTCANALAWSWNIPVAGIHKGEPIQDALSYCTTYKDFDKSVVPVYAKSPV